MCKFHRRRSMPRRIIGDNQPLEDRSEKQALLVRVDSGGLVARGRLVDEFFTGTRVCHWR